MSERLETRTGRSFDRSDRTDRRDRTSRNDGSDLLELLDGTGICYFWHCFLCFLWNGTDRENGRVVLREQCERDSTQHSGRADHVVRSSRYWRVVEIDRDIPEDSLLDISESVRPSSRPRETDRPVETILAIVELVIQNSDDRTIMFAFDIDRDQTSRSSQTASSERLRITSASVSDLLDRVPRDESDRDTPTVRACLRSDLRRRDRPRERLANFFC
jgi:hypothetical protein